MNKQFRRNGIRHAPYQFTEEDNNILRNDWQSFVAKKKRMPKAFCGKGIVFTAGGIKYTTCAWVAVSLLRSVGCNLPIEFWYLGNEISKEVVESFETLNVEFRNFNEIGKVALAGFMLKPLAIIHSRFKEVLFLDADNNCVKDPEYLFSSEEYKQHGCIFWPDYFKTSKSNSIWSIIGTHTYNIPEQESGQILINKERCWQELQLCLYFNRLSKYYYRILFGDKDTFKFAWLALKSTFYMVEHPVGSCGFKENEHFCGNTMVQHDPTGEILFLHRNLLKWDLTKSSEISWTHIKRFNEGAKRKGVFFKNSSKGLCLDLTGDTNEIEFESLFNGIEIKCLDFLNQWRNSEVYGKFMHYSYFAKNRYFDFKCFEL